MKNKIILTLITLCVSLLILLIVTVRLNNRYLEEIKEYERVINAVDLLKLKVEIMKFNARYIEVMRELEFAYNAYDGVGEKKLKRIENKKSRIKKEKE